MNELKKKLAILLAVCMIMTNVLPVFAEPVYEPLTTEDQYTETKETELTIAEESSEDFEYEQATPPNASYNELCIDEQEEAGLADDEYTGLTEFEDNPDELIPEEATPANARYTDEIFIREAVVDGMTITLTADPGVFPEDAELWAEKVEDEVAEEAIEEAVEKERENNVNVAASYKFDIKMFVNGEEVQPDTSKGSVKVTFTLAEELSECLDANAYHLKEDAAGELTAENLGAEVKTVEEADEETVKEAGNTSETASTVGADEDGILADGIIDDDVTKKVTKLEADTYGFSYYVVEFTYDELQYVLQGDSSIKLSKILNTLKIEGTVTEAEVSNSELFTVEKDTEGDDWTVTALQAFSTKEWMKVTIGGKVYEITVTDDNTTHTHGSEGDAVTFERSITSFEELNYLFTNGGSGYLADDINTNTMLTVAMGKTVNLCLNGHFINQKAFKSVIYVQNDATLNLYDCNSENKAYKYTVDNNGSWSYGGKWAETDKENDTTKKITGGIITGGTGHTDGGRYIKGGGVYVDSAGTFTMNGGTIAGNSVINYGGGVYNSGTFTMNDGNICCNRSYSGGGIYNSAGQTIIQGGTISGNTADYGGGIYNDAGKTIIQGGTISGNTAAFGGGIQSGDGEVYLTAGAYKTINITDNTATGAEGGIANWAKLHLSGKVIIMNNICKSANRPVNLATNKVIIIDGDLTDSEIHLTHANNNTDVFDTGVLTSGFAAKNPSAKLGDFFIYDGPGNYQMVLNKDDELEVMEKSYAITNGSPVSAEETNHGYISIDKDTAAEGKTVTVDVNPADSYQLKTLKYNDGTTDHDITMDANTRKYQFTMPAKAVTVTAEFEEKAITIADILPEDFPTSSAGDWLNENGKKSYIMNGNLFVYGQNNVDLSKSVTKKDDGNYEYQDTSGTKITFVMESGKLTNIIVSGSGCPENNGTYAPHVHVFTYTANGGKLTATCTDGCDKGYDKNPLTLTLTAPASLVYDGNAKVFDFASGEEAAWKTGTGNDAPAITYYQKQSGQEDKPLEGSPKDAGNYKAKITEDGKAAQVEFTITKATPYIKTNPAPSAINNGQKLADSTLFGGYAQASSTDSSQVAGLFEWTNPNIIPSIADSEITPYSVTFTPVDENNYNTVSCDVKITVNSTQTHTHSFNYEASGGKLTATCNGDGDCIYKTNKLTLTLTAPASLVYDGNAKSFTFASGEEAAWTGAGLELPTIYYYIKQSGQSEYMPLLGTLKDPGNYMAKITVGGKEAQIKFAIETEIHIHKAVLVTGQAPTQEAAGWKDYYKCACGDLFEDANAKTSIDNLDTWKAKGGRGYIPPLPAPATFTVTFIYRNGTENIIKTVKYNETVTKPQNPDMTGYTFERWCSDDKCEIPYDFSKQVKNNLSLYAKWTKIDETEGKVRTENKPIEVTVQTTKQEEKVLLEDLEKNTGASVESSKSLANAVKDKVKEEITQTGKDVILFIDTKLTGIKVENPHTGSTEKATTTLTYEATPKMSTVDSDGKVAETQLISNSDLNGNITLRLPVPKSVNEKYVNIVHSSEGYPKKTYRNLEIVKKGTDEAYVEIQISHFSTFELTFSDEKSVDPVPQRSNSDSTSTLFTGTWGSPVTNGTWRYDPETDKWSYTTTFKFTDTWGYIANPYAGNEAAWFYFDKNGNMLTGWQLLFWKGSKKWYYFNPVKDSRRGKCQLGGVTPDGWTVDESGAWIESIPRK